MQKNVDPESESSGRRSRPHGPSKAAPTAGPAAGSADDVSSTTAEAKHRGKSAAKPGRTRRTTSANVRQEEERQHSISRKDGNMAQPLIIDLGSVSRKEAKRLKRGTGVKLEEVMRAAQEARNSGAPDAPIVVLYRKKRKRNRSLFPFPLPFSN